MKRLSEKQRIIQEQAKLIKLKEKESITDATSAKDKEILAAAEKLEQKERAYAEMSKRLDDTEAISTQAMNDLSEKEKIIQEQAKLIEEKYGRKKKRRDVGKEALDDDDEIDGQRDRRRSGRGYGETSTHPLLSLTLSPYSLFSLSVSHVPLLCLQILLALHRGVPTAIQLMSSNCWNYYSRSLIL